MDHRSLLKRDSLGSGIERSEPPRLRHRARDVEQVLRVPRDGDVPSPAGWHGERLRLATRLSGFLVDPETPQVHRAAAVAREKNRPAVWIPHGVPVERSVAGCGDDGLRIAIDGDRVDVALPTFRWKAPEENALSIWREAPLHGVARE